MLTKVFVHSVAVFFTLYGIAFALIPEFMLQLVIGTNETTSTGLIDIRATYGGMSLAVGMLLHWLALQRTQVNLALPFILLLMLAMALPRMLGMAVDGEPNGVMYLYLTLELSVSALAIILLRLNNKAS